MLFLKSNAVNVASCEPKDYQAYVLLFCIFLEKTKFTASPITDLETWIDAFTKELPPLTNFILPVSLFLHL